MRLSGLPAFRYCKLFGVSRDASKFDAPSGNVVCNLNEIDTIITSDRISDAAPQMIERAGVRLEIVARK